MRPAHVVYALAGSPPQADRIEVQVVTRYGCGAIAVHPALHEAVRRSA